MDSSTAVRAVGAITQQVQATNKSIPLSSAANTLTGYIFGDVLQLPPYLQGYGNLLWVVIGGASVANRLHDYFQLYQNHRSKVKIAVFHIIRLLEVQSTEQSNRLQEHP
jgi:hypothetical protein